MSSAAAPFSENGNESIQENKIILVLSLCVWLVVMNTTMFNVALPYVLIDLNLTSATAAWIVSGYSIVFAIATITYSRLSDFIPISKLLVIGLFLLGAASVIGLFSNQFYLLLIARIIQAAGAGAVPALAMVLAGRYIPVYRRGKAMAYIASASSLGFGLGPIIGGVVTQYLGWNFLFLVTGLIFFLIPFLMKWLPKEQFQEGRFDIVGAGVTSLTVTGALLFLSTFSFPYLIVSIMLLIYLWKHIHQRKLPFIQPDLIKNKQYMKLVYLGFIAFVVHFSVLFLLPIILTLVFEAEPLIVGMMIFPGAILFAVAAQFIGRLIDRFGNLPIIIFGQSMMMVACILFTFTATMSPYFILFTYMFMSIGFSAQTSSYSNEYTRILASNKIGAGLGMAQLFQFIGGAFGVTLTGLLLTLQNGIDAEISYRNTFIVLILLIMTSMGTFVLYLKNRKK